MERPACGTLPPLPPRRILENVRERFAALRGTSEPPRLLLDIRPHGDTSEQFDGAIELELASAPVNHKRFLCGGMVANEGNEGRSMVRAWLIGEPSPLDAAKAACRDAGAWLRPLLVSARLVDDSLRPAGLVWPAALACLTPGAHRLTRFGGVDFLIPETEIPPPGALPAAAAWMLSIGFRLNDAPASGPLPEMFERPVGSEFTPDRLFVIEDVVETSIILVDRLIEGLPKTTGDGKDSAGGAGGERGEGRRTKGNRRGKARQSVDVDALLLRLVRAISKKCRDEDLESFLVREVYSKGSADLSEMLRDHLAEDVSPQTIRRKVVGRHASKLYAEWSRFRTAAGGEASDLDDDVQRNSAPMSNRDAQVDEMLRSGVVTKRNRRRA